MRLYILSAALYGVPKPHPRVSVDWANEMVHFFEDHHLPLQECSYVTVSKKDVGPCSFPKVQKTVWKRLEDKQLLRLDLYAHRKQPSALLFDWEGKSHLDMEDCEAYLGVPVTVEIDYAELLRFLYTASKPLARWVYGNAYVYPAFRAPAFYAIGMLSGNKPEDAGDFVELSDEEEEKVADWWRERGGQRRHLRGWFRDVYPANLLSDQHVNARLKGNKTLLKSGLGTFEQLDPDVWLWEVPNTQIPAARKALTEAGLLICT